MKAREMQAPNYNWSCFRCDASNVAGRGHCQSCGFSANASGEQIREAQQPSAGSPDDTAAQSRSGRRLTLSISLFFPEAIAAAVVLLCSPFWAVRLFEEGKIANGAFLLFAVVAAAGLLVLAHKEASQGLAYVAVVLLCIAGYAGFGK